MVEVDESFEVALPRGPDAPSLARRLIAQLGESRLDADQLERAKLAVSELVTNALVHGRGAITLRAGVDHDRLMVEVIDEGSGFERVVRRQTFEDLHGRGLMIVDAQASRWGLHEGTTHVWFEIERAGPRLDPDSNPVADAVD